MSASLESALVASADKAPKRAEDCAYDVSARVWLAPQQVATLERRRLCMLLYGFEYQVAKARTTLSTCKRCGLRFERGHIRVGYPSVGKETGRGKAFAVWLHLKCSLKEQRLRELAEQGDKMMRNRVLGYDALKPAERSQLREDLINPDHALCTTEESTPQPPAVPDPKALQKREAPSALCAELLPFQAEGLWWMLAQEKDPKCRGGILADEMGMGKTLQTIALILASDLDGPTLVVVPASGLFQWRSEVRKYTQRKSLPVRFYFGAGRSLAELDGTKRRVVLTTYQTLEHEYRQDVNQYKRKCQWCGRLFMPDGLAHHQKYYCGPDSLRSEKRLRRGWLKRAHCVVASQPDDGAKEELSPEQIRRKRRRLCTVAASETADGDQPDHALPRDLSATQLNAATEDSDLEDKGDIKLSAPLFCVRWSRVVLDEAHRIKFRNSSTACAAFELKAKRRWCLTGTPLQNRVGELYSVVRFLRFHPFAYYSCARRDCDCCVLRLITEKSEEGAIGVCKRCGHSRAVHRNVFSCKISNPIRQFGFLGKGREAMETLRNDLLNQILLRRTKIERAEDVQLPPVKVRIRKCELSAKERRFYDRVKEECQTAYHEYVVAGTVMSNFAHIFALILRQRQAALHRYLVSYSASLGPSDADVCCLCFEEITDETTRAAAKCGHSFHHECGVTYMLESPTYHAEWWNECPFCAGARGRTTPASSAAEVLPLPRRSPGSILQRVEKAGKKLKTSSKIEAVICEIQKQFARNSTRKSKFLIFSQFTSFLDLLEWRLELEEVTAAKIVGSMSPAQKDNIVERFQNGHMDVLLISLKTGGEGLNLQEANNVFLLDPWWNPAAELQAIQRAHRIGQTRRVRAVRFVSAETIEEKMLELQEKKQFVFDCTVGNSNDALVKLTGEDIQQLFTS